MKAGVPYWLIFPVFFGPCIVLVITGNLFWFVMIPVLWYGARWAYGTNPNRPFEWILWVTSGSFFSDWHMWGGATRDPHSKPDKWSGSL
jgi:type IV secretory pathway VirB3-like protein